MLTVQAENLRKQFGSFTAVDGISFAIQTGEVFGFLGPNGAGKTSTMRMMGCVSPISDGKLEILGMDVRKRPRSIKRRLGVAPQDDNLDQFLSVRENLRLYGRYFDIPRKELDSRCDEMLHFVQLTDRGEHDVRTLSGGMKRRLLIARALISRPDLVILDEPTTGLDPQARHLLWEKLRMLKKQERTLILSTHYMDEAEQLCDRLVFMEAGRIIAHGTPAELIGEHVSREVVEVFGTPEDLAPLQQSVGPLAARHELLQDRLMLFVDKADTIVPQIPHPADHPFKVLTRRSTLEDVFLKLTGRSLVE